MDLALTYAFAEFAVVARFCATALQTVVPDLGDIQALRSFEKQLQDVAAVAHQRGLIPAAPEAHAAHELAVFCDWCNRVADLFAQYKTLGEEIDLLYESRRATVPDSHSTDAGGDGKDEMGYAGISPDCRLSRDVLEGRVGSLESARETLRRDAASLWAKASGLEWVKASTVAGVAAAWQMEGSFASAADVKGQLEMLAACRDVAARYPGVGGDVDAWDAEVLKWDSILLSRATKASELLSEWDRQHDLAAAVQRDLNSGDVSAAEHLLLQRLDLFLDDGGDQAAQQVAQAKQILGEIDQVAAFVAGGELLPGGKQASQFILNQATALATCWPEELRVQLLGGLADNLRKLQNRLERRNALLGIGKISVAIAVAAAIGLAAIAPFIEGCERASRAAAVRKSLLRNSLGMGFRLIPASSFGGGAGGGSQGVDRDVYIGIHEVTNAQWQAVMKTSPSPLPADDLPVVNVDWNTATEFCRRLSEVPEERAAGREYRLLAEAEWEYCCRADSISQYCFGDDSSSLENYAWFRLNSDQRPHAVGEKQPNDWGLYDMHGNVFEWCQDWYIGGEQRVCRGGAWTSSVEYCTSGFRLNFDPSTRTPYLGLRVAMTISKAL